MYIAKAFAQRAQFDEAINEVKQTLGPDVVLLRYSLGHDWSGDPAVFFRIVLAEAATRRDLLLSTTKQIETEIVQRIRPLEEWGVLDYFEYRSQSEQASHQEKAWA